MPLCFSLSGVDMHQFVMAQSCNFLHQKAAVNSESIMDRGYVDLTVIGEGSVPGIRKHFRFTLDFNMSFLLFCESGLVMLQL